METKKEYYQIGELLGTPVYYHKTQEIDSVAISYGPVNKNPNEGRSIIVPGFVYEPTSNEIKIPSDVVEILNRKSVSSKYKVVESIEDPIYAKPTGDPTKPYYIDNGEPYIPFSTPYKCSFICTGYKDFEEFNNIHGVKTIERVTEKLKIYNKKFIN